jgi:DNA-binding NarL/FixJ family response regulator
MVVSQETPAMNESWEKSKKLNVLVTAENHVSRYGVSAMLLALPRVGCQEGCGDFTTALESIRGNRFHVLVLSLGFGEEQCGRLAVAAIESDVKVLLLLDSSAPQHAARVGKIPLDGFLVQNELTIEMLDDALLRVMKGELPMPSKLARELLTHVVWGKVVRPPPPRRVALTPSEQQTLSMLAEGMSNKQIARRLGISEHGAKRHVANVLAKLNCPNRTTAAVIAIQAGILPEASP